MINDFEDLRSTLAAVFGNDSPPPTLHLVEAASRVRTGSLSAQEAARIAHSTPQQINRVALAADPLAEILGAPRQSPDSRLEARVRGALGQLVIGRIAEAVFERMYREFVGVEDLGLQDDRQGRGDTDYLVFDRQDRQVFRINIKFHGSQFRNARELVGLDPNDCFALATYKIHSALQKQEAEHLPYIFVIVGVPGLTGPLLGQVIPAALVDLSALSYQSARISGKRLIEDRIVDVLMAHPEQFGFEDVLREHTAQIGAAPWYVLSARRANKLLLDNLFQRAYALRVRAFARNYPGAELDMHFSLSQDLCPLPEFLAVLRDSGMPGLVTRLERGTL